MICYMNIYVDELLYACLCWIIMKLYDVAINDEYDMIYELIYEYTHWWSIIWITCWWIITWRHVYMLMIIIWITCWGITTWTAYVELTWWISMRL